MAASWTLGLVDVNGTPLTEGGITLARNVEMTFTAATAPSIIQFLLPLTAPEAAIIAADTEVDRYVKAYRTPDGGSVTDRELKFYGSIWVDEVQGANGADALMVTAMDQMAMLAKRFTLAQFSVMDLGAILQSMIDTTNSTDGETGIRTSASNITASSTIDLDARTNKPTILSIAEQFAGQLDGCEAWVEPIELAAGKVCDFYAAPRRGVTNEDAVFAYGPESLTNCVSMSRTRDKALVENDTNGYTDTLTSQKTDATSIAALRRLVGYTSLTGETSQTVLDARTQGRLDDLSTLSKVAVYKAQPDQSAPVLFEDYDVGDTVTLDFRKGIEWEVQQRVVSAKISLTDGGLLERPAQLEFKTP